MKKWLSGFLLVTLILACSITAGAVSGEITVNGEGVITVEPDIAYVSLGVNVSAATANEAQVKNATLMSQIIRDLNNSGIDSKDIQTTNFNLFPEYRTTKDSEPDQVIGYRAMNQLAVTIRDIRKVGEVIDLSIKAGANNINSVIFSVNSTESLRDRAIEAAVKDAQSKAEVMAKAAKVNIKRVLSINESAVNVRPMQMDTLYKSALGNAINTPIETGNVKVTVNIQMRFEI
jgi:uncharacterized protein YggE